MARSIGVVECDCYSDVVGAADRLIKAADVRLKRREEIGDGHVALIIEGETDEVERGLAAAKDGAPESLWTTLVPNASNRVTGVFKL